MAEVDFTSNGSEGQFGDSQEGKIFVGGLSWETTTKDLKDYFGKYGDVVDCTLKTDPSTGRSRGFGFVLFGSSESVDKVLNEGSHQLHGRTIDPKRAKARGGREPVLKVFVGGLDPSIPETEIKEYFEQSFGKIKDIDLPFDKQKGQRRAFCFVTFESESAVELACQEPKQTISGKQVDIKKATPKDGNSWGGRGGYGGGGYGGRGGRGRGRGRGRGGEDYGGYGSGGWGGYDYNSGGYGSYDYNSGYGYGNYDYYGNNQGGYGGYGQGGWGGNQGGYYGNQGGYSGYGGYDQDE